ncbi:hypothetical protein GCM10011369_30240 [Neiella marina]|uniref:Uncharacterized protein n=1 Tax=Neiella marina TaxID=508461 RepID=A0A8J2U8G4_9GAMM|nr:hypothetical protein [Neiella marina]GGA86140.1 hypothetical protein GCM10011369_30240 [Neiella marina]
MKISNAILAVGCCLFLGTKATVAEVSQDTAIDAAVNDFLAIQETEGNQVAIEQLLQCYASAVENTNEGKLKYCIAFDSALIEYSYGIYLALGDLDLQPELSRREVGASRMIANARAAHVDNPSQYAQGIYNLAAQRLLATVKAKYQ